MLLCKSHSRMIPAVKKNKQVKKEGEKMEQGLRYTMNNIGDILVDSLENFWCKITLSTKGVKLTYNIHELNNKKIKVQKKIGQRLSDIKKKSPELEIFEDDELAKLFSILETLEEEINTNVYEREERLYPKKPYDEQIA